MTVVTPWRYPGGKSRQAARLLTYIPEGVRGFADPFVGGGNPLIPFLERELKSKRDMSTLTIRINDGDPRVAAWWKVVATGTDAEFEALMTLIDTQVVTIEAFYNMKALDVTAVGNPVVAAFVGIFLNRTAFSGILSGGPIGGRAQTSAYTVDCRWNPHRLAVNHRKVRALFAGVDVRVTNVDFAEFMDGLGDEFLFLDPPYFDKGHRLYPHEFTVADHERLAEMLHGRGDWVLTYDSDPWVLETYKAQLVEPVDVKYTISGEGREGHVEATEVVITPI